MEYSLSSITASLPRSLMRLSLTYRYLFLPSSSALLTFPSPSSPLSLPSCSPYPIPFPSFPVSSFFSSFFFIPLSLLEATLQVSLKHITLKLQACYNLIQFLCFVKEKFTALDSFAFVTLSFPSSFLCTKAVRIFTAL